MGGKERIFARVPDGRLLAIRNWRHRQHEDDALIAVPLTADEVEHYLRQKKAGVGDEQIFDELFPPPVLKRVTIPIEELSKPQLVALIGQVLDRKLKSLERMERQDLAVLLRAFCRERGRTQAYLI